MQTEKTKTEAGFTLIETMLACVILTICATGILSLFTISVIKNANRGDDATRTTEYAQDKMEQLMALQFQDVTSNTIFHFDGTKMYPPCLNFSMTNPCSAGTGLTAPGGSLTTDTAGYVDYISLSNVSNTWVSSDSLTGASFVRRWHITLDSTTKVKIIEVSVISLKGLAVSSSKLMDGITPQTTVVSQKTAVGDTFLPSP
jgi:prepilin-type N-terminal cleavage/methylation domain-containing protein